MSALENVLGAGESQIVGQFPRSAHGLLEMEPIVGLVRIALNFGHVDDALLELSPNNNNNNKDREGIHMCKKPCPAVPDPVSYRNISYTTAWTQDRRETSGHSCTRNERAPR